MSKLANQYKKFMKELEQNIENKEDYNRIQAEVSKLFVLFLDEMDEMKESYENKIDTILERQSDFDEKITRIESVVNNIQRDIYMDEGSDFEILCPYCGNEFVVQLDELKDEVECPECKNLIELDWNDCEDNECDGNCHGCNGNDHYDEDDDM